MSRSQKSLFRLSKFKLELAKVQKVEIWKCQHDYHTKILKLDLLYLFQIDLRRPQRSSSKMIVFLNRLQLGCLQKQWKFVQHHFKLSEHTGAARLFLKVDSEVLSSGGLTLLAFLLIDFSSLL